MDYMTDLISRARVKFAKEVRMLNSMDDPHIAMPEGVVEFRQVDVYPFYDYYIGESGYLITSDGIIQKECV